MKELCAISPGQIPIIAINLFDWESSLKNSDVNDQVSVFNEIIMNIKSNFVPKELVTCYDRDPPWLNCGSLWPLMIFVNKFFCLPAIWTSFLCLKFTKLVNSIN